MPSSLTCPDDAELLALAAGDPPSAEMRSHLDECASCRARLGRFQAELAQLRAGAPVAGPSPSTAQEPTSRLSSTNGRGDDRGATAPWESDGATEAGPPASQTEPGSGNESGGIEGAPVLPAAIGKYLVIGRFPRTGQAEVFRVVHPGLAKDLVLKLALEPVRPDGRCEIIEEAKILAELEHPNLVRVYDIDFQDDRPYLVMEYIRGRTLEQVAGEGRIRTSRLAALLTKVAGAAEYAHRHGIIHRDIKPGNILIDESGEPWLIEFGMAGLRHAYAEEPGRPGGTFAFMPPEQARVEPPEEKQKVGPRSDVFALGAVLYFLLTGKVPFPGSNWRESQSRARHCDFDRRALDDPPIPRALRRVCLKGMAPDPADRFVSAEAFRKALNRYLLWPTIRAAVAGATGLVLLGVLGYQALSRWAIPPAHTSSDSKFVWLAPGGPSIAPAAKPMKGRIDLLVVKSKDGTRRRLRLEDRGSVPVKADDEFRIEARLNRPAYLYLFWIGSEGKVAPLYPWKDHDWSTRPADEQTVTGVELPEIVDRVLTIPHSAPGLETLVLLAREDSPLPREDESRLAQGLAGSAVPMPPGMREAIWLEDGQEVVFGEARGTTKGGHGEEDLSRGVPSPTTRKSDDPVLRIRAFLNDKLQPLGSYNQAVLFPNIGG
jgi:Protein kinase domain/Domain of unknown function (DUF4384)